MFKPLIKLKSKFMEEVIEDINDNKVQEIPQAVKVLAILTYVGNGLILLALLFFAAFFSSVGARFGAFRAIGGEMGIIVAVFLFVALLCVGAIVGAIKMHKGQKSGFTIYAISNGIYIALALIGLVNNPQPNNFVGPLITIGFFIGFYNNLKYLK